MTDLQPLLSVSDVAIIVGMTDDTVRQAIRDGELPASKLRGRIRITQADVHAWINAAAITPTPTRAADRRPVTIQVPTLPKAATPENIDALIAAGRRQVKAA